MFRKLDTEKTGTIELNLVNVSSFSSKMFVVIFWGEVNNRDSCFILTDYMYSHICWIYIDCVFISSLKKGYPFFKMYLHHIVFSNRQARFLECAATFHLLAVILANMYAGFFPAFSVNSRVKCKCSSDLW